MGNFLKIAIIVGFWYLVITIFGIDDWLIGKIKKTNNTAYALYAQNDIKKSIKQCYQMDIHKVVCDMYAQGRLVQLQSELDRLFEGRYDSYGSLLYEQGELVVAADKAVQALGYDGVMREIKKDKALCEVYNTLSKQLGDKNLFDCDDYPNELGKAEGGTWGFIQFLNKVK